MRNYSEEKAKARVKAIQASGDHPLMPQALLLARKKVLEAEATAGAGASGLQPPSPLPEADPLEDPLAGRSRVAVDEDPLAMMMGGASPVAAGFDPLSSPPKAMAAAASDSAGLSAAAATASDYGGGDRGGGVPKLAWDTVKRSILKEFNVEGAVNFGAGTFSDEGEFDESGGSAGKSVDLRAKKRLQQLEKDAGVVQPGVEMSQVRMLYFYNAPFSSS
jgi:hypothetical protein